MRFTHANRHCPDHPYDTLRRCEDEFVINSMPDEQSTEILKWLQKYREERHQQLQQLQNQTTMTPPNTTRKTPKRSSSTIKNNDENKRRYQKPSSIENYESQENCDTTTTSNGAELLLMSPSKGKLMARKGLMCELDMNVDGGGSVRGGFVTSSPMPIPLSQVSLDPSHNHSMFQTIIGSPLSSAGKLKPCRPKIILWKEPLDNDDELFDGTANNTALRMNGYPSASSDENLMRKEPEIIPVIVPNEIQHRQTTSLTSSTFNPKKKWLRDAWQEDLGTKPLDYGCNHPLYKNPETSNWQMASSSTTSSHLNTDPNQNRPSVLMTATKDAAPHYWNELN